MIVSWLRIIVGVVFNALVLVLFIPPMLICLPSRRIRIRLGNAAGHIIGRTLLFLSGAEVDPMAPIEAGRHRPAIYISNHTSILDIFLGIWVAPYGCVGVAKKQVVWYPFFGLLYLLAGHLRLDRSNHERALEALADLTVLVKRYNLSVWLWPEGTRSRDGRLRGFKKGFAHMAIATGLPVVPIVVAGAHRSWRHGSWKIHPTQVKITVLPPIPTTDWTLDNLDEKVAMVRSQIEQALPPEQRGSAPAGALEMNAEGAQNLQQNAEVLGK